MSFTGEDENAALAATLGGMSIDDAVDTWNAIVNDVRRQGPMARLITVYHKDAKLALRDLAICSRDKFKDDTEHSKAVTDLQQRIQQFLLVMVTIQTFRSVAKGVEADEELSEEDDRYIVRAIED